jgi:small multidrug resistance family-3 protein
MFIAKTLGLFILTAIAEWLKKNASIGLLLPAAASLALFVWLLSLQPTAAGRVYAAYGGVYVAVAILWLWLVNAIRPTIWDMIGVIVCLAGMAIIMLGSHHA